MEYKNSDLKKIKKIFPFRFRHIDRGYIYETKDRYIQCEIWNMCDYNSFYINNDDKDYDYVITYRDLTDKNNFISYRINYYPMKQKLYIHKNIANNHEFIEQENVSIMDMIECIEKQFEFLNK